MGRLRDVVQLSSVLVSALWRAGRRPFLCWSVLALVGPVLPIASIVLFAQLIGAVPDAARDGADSAAGHRLLALSILAGLAFVLVRTTQNVSRAVDQMLARRLEAQLQRDALDALERFDGLGQLEDPDVQEAVGFARDIETAIHPAGSAVNAVRVFLVGTVTGILAVAILATFRWWAPFLLLIGWLLLELWSEKRQTPENRALQLGHARRYEFYRELALEPLAAKESRVFGLGPWIASRAGRHWLEGMQIGWHDRRAPRALVAGIFALQFGAYTLVLWLLVRAGANGELSIERVAVYLQALFSPLANITQPGAVMRLRQAVRPVRYVQRLRGMRPPRDHRAPGSSSDADAEGLPRSEIRLRGVCFRYPGTGREVLSGLDLRIPAGRSVAIVGENGAGKTTIVKLLTRLYEPDQGSIEVDGRPLAALGVSAWRGRLGAVFQDFARFPLTMRENIVFGRLGTAEDEAILDQAVRGADLDQIVGRLADGIDTVLAREFGGVDLSGGQWQRVALARALYSARAGAGVLILDEPTASLDVRSETELFERFMELTRGLTTILISHRFSTVRRADLICVIEQGRLIEQGTHDALMAHGGRYAEMFTLQASRFADTGHARA